MNFHINMPKTISIGRGFNYQNKRCIVLVSLNPKPLPKSAKKKKDSVGQLADPTLHSPPYNIAWPPASSSVSPVSPLSQASRLVLDLSRVNFLILLSPPEHPYLGPLPTHPTQTRLRGRRQAFHAQVVAPARIACQQ